MKSEKKSKLFRISKESEKEILELKGYLNYNSQDRVVEAAVKNLYDHKISSDYLLMQQDKVEKVLFNQISMMLKVQMEQIAILMNDINRNQRITSILLETCLLSIADISDNKAAKKTIINSLKYTKVVKEILESMNG